MKYLRLIIMFISLTSVAKAQSGRLKAYHVVFEDNFSDDTVGKFPKKWDQFQKVYSTKTYIKEYAGEKELHIEKQVFLKPLIESLVNIGDALKIELDYKPDTTDETFTISIFNENDRKEGNYIYVVGNDSLFFQLYKEDNLSKWVRFAQPVESKQWHNITYTIKKGLLSLCIDTNCYFMHNDAVAIPEESIITFGFIGNASIKNIKISTANNTRDFAALNTDKKIVTHAINFEKRRFTIAPFSNAYIKDLAAWLNANPAIELEIDGHTDNDGNKELNAALSLSRANEVKRTLVANGVAESRLTTKGYGADKPLDNTNTPAAKAMNRRVEFIKIK